MRLEKVHSGHRLGTKLLFGIMRLVTGVPVTGVMRTLRYRREYLGRWLSALTHEVMRGESAWSAGERELMAAYVSSLNQCPFCTGAHSAFADAAMPGDVVRRVLDDPETAPIAEGLRATLRFLKKVTLSPAEVGPADVRAAAEAGVSPAALADAARVAFVFNVFNRLADTLGWEVPLASFFRRGARFVLSHGYKAL